MVFNLQQKKKYAKKTHRLKGSEFAHYHENWTVEDLQKNIRQILIELGLTKRCMCRRREENQYLTELLLQQ